MKPFLFAAGVLLGSEFGDAHSWLVVVAAATVGYGVGQAIQKGLNPL